MNFAQLLEKIYDFVYEFLRLSSYDSDILFLLFIFCLCLTFVILSTLIFSASIRREKRESRRKYRVLKKKYKCKHIQYILAHIKNSSKGYIYNYIIANDDGLRLVADGENPDLFISYSRINYAYYNKQKYYIYTISVLPILSIKYDLVLHSEAIATPRIEFETSHTISAHAFNKNSKVKRFHRFVKKHILLKKQNQEFPEKDVINL